MKFMKLGSRPDTFYSSNGVRSISLTVKTDFVIQVNETRYLLHKFPLLSKCLKLQTLCSENTKSSQLQIIECHDIPGGKAAFELCAKFCYGITITISAYNIVSTRCAAKYLQMTEEVEKGNLVQKLDIFFNSCILKGWKDCIVTLQTTRKFQLWSEEMEITSRCVESVVSKVVLNPLKMNLSNSNTNENGIKENTYTTKKWWGDDISELRIELYWRTMAALKSGGKVPPNLIGDCLKVYTSKWLPKISKDFEFGSSLNNELEGSSSNSKLMLESIITLLPIETNSVSCSFLLKLLKAANIFQASVSSRLELARRVALQLDEAKVFDLMIPSISNDCDTVYDIDIILDILEQFLLQCQSQQISLRKTVKFEENGDCVFNETCRSSYSSVLNGSMIKVAKVVDEYLQEIGKDVNVPLSKFNVLIKTIPDFVRLNHDDLYRAIDIYLKSHPDLKKSERKDLCRTLDCKKLSLEARIHAAQNELLPLRVVVQVLLCEQARAAMASNQLTVLPNHIRVLLADKGINTSTPQQMGQLVKSRNPSLADDDHSYTDSVKVQQNCLVPTQYK